MSGETLFETQRSRILNKYKGAGVAFNCSTKPYKSTGQIVFSVTETHPSAARTMTHLVARAGQRIEFFSYGVGDAIPYGINEGNPLTRNALESDTNLSKGRRTNGVEDFIIEGISATAKATRINYNAADMQITVGDTALADADVLGAYKSKVVSVDPGALMQPPQVGSPFNLEHTLFEALKPQISVEFEWDRTRVEKIGTLDEIPEGGAKSYLKASGAPMNQNRYKVPEGYVWRQQGQPDSEFVVRCVLAEPVVIPISLIQIQGDVTASHTSLPSHVFLDLTMRLHGLAVKLPSNN